MILTWNDQSSDEDNFIVERCTGASCSSFAPIATAPANATSYTDNTTARRTNYSYRVKARRNPADDSAYSNVASTRTK